MAGVALLVFERVVQERLHQHRRIGLARIVALNAISRLKGLVPVGLAKLFIFGVMTVKTELGNRLGEMVGKVELGGIAALVHDVAGVAAIVERRMTAATLGNMHPHVVASEAEVLRLAT